MARVRETITLSRDCKNFLDKNILLTCCSFIIVSLQAVILTPVSGASFIQFLKVLLGKLESILLLHFSWARECRKNTFLSPRSDRPRYLNIKLFLSDMLVTSSIAALLEKKESKKREAEAAIQAAALSVQNSPPYTPRCFALDFFSLAVFFYPSLSNKI